MEYTEWDSSQDAEYTREVPEQAQVPSTLMPTILHRLGLPSNSHGQTLTEAEISMDDVLAQLKSDDWEVRVAAVRALGKRDAGIPLEPLLSTLNDEDASVRAAAVHVLGHLGRRAPLPRLIAAFHDPDWHVRETVMFALAQQEQHVPQDVFMTALRDTDGSVQEAAKLALQWNKEKTSTSYGQLREQKNMQQNSNDTSLANGKHGRSSFPTVPSDTWNSSGEDSRNAERTYSAEEQMQEYVPQEFEPYAYSSTLSAQREKLTRETRRPHKGWLAIIAITAILFFLMGVGISSWTISAIKTPQTQQVSISVPKPSMSLNKLISNPYYAVIVQKSVASALQLTPEQIATQLQAGQSMTAIAAAQGISSQQLQSIELKAFQDLLGVAVSAGDINQQDANLWTKSFDNNSQLLDTMTVQAFEVGTGKS